MKLLLCLAFLSPLGIAATPRTLEGAPPTHSVAANFHATDVHLSPGLDYAQRLRSLRKGDVVRFEDGRSFTLGKRLGRGKSAVIYAVDLYSAIRIPLANDSGRPRMQHFRSGWGQVRELKLPVLEILDLDN